MMFDVFFFSKDLAVLLCAFVAVQAQGIKDEIIESQPAQFMPMGMGMGMGGMGMNPMMMMSRNQFPIDYSKRNLIFKELFIKPKNLVRPRMLRKLWMRSEMSNDLVDAM